MLDHPEHKYMALDTTVDLQDEIDESAVDQWPFIPSQEKHTAVYLDRSTISWDMLRKQSKLTITVIALMSLAVLVMMADEGQRLISSLLPGQASANKIAETIDLPKGKALWAYQVTVAASTNSCKAFREKIKPVVASSKCKVTHLPAAIGDSSLFSSLDPLTHQERFAPYTDSSLGLRYRLMDKDNDVHKVDELLGPLKPSSLSHEDWTKYLQDRNIIINTRLQKHETADIPNWKALSEGCGHEDWARQKPKQRTAIVFRYYEGFVMTEDEILDLRAMLSEVVINRPQDGRSIYLLVEVKETSGALMSRTLQEDVLMPMMPREFWGLVEFWTVNSTQLFVPGVIGPGSYETRKDCILATQLFSHLHPEYDFVYNWEADLRFMGSYRSFFDTIENYARGEPFSKDLARYSKFYISGLNTSDFGRDVDDNETRGRGKEADLIALDPFLDTNGSGWMHWATKYNYGPGVPLRTSIVSMVRLSKQLARSMNLATVLRGKSMQCEAWPVTVALHSQLPPSDDQTFDTELFDILGKDFPLKAVYVPNPVFLSKAWKPQEVNAAVNDPQYLKDDTFMRKSTYLWGSEYLPDMYERWRRGVGNDACRSQAFVHPVKNVGY